MKMAWETPFRRCSLKKINYKYIIPVIISAFMCIVTMISWILSNKKEESYVETYGDAHTYDIGDTKETTDILYAVYITGAVNNPGVYYIKKGSIVADVITMAGGMQQEADTSAINLASKVTDSMMIVVYTTQEIKAGINKTNGAENTPVNINYATKEQLMTLPGIGESKADSIIAYRETNGGFEKVEEIMNISGIKEALFNKIKDLITT